MPRPFDLPCHADERGALTVAEDALPFRPVRVFWITGADGQTRGGHRHRRTELVLVAVAGRVVINVETPSSSGTFVLDAPHRALYLAPEDWHTMEFGKSAVLLVIASLGYDRQDYITERHRHDP